MLRSGISSVSYRNAKPAEVIAAARGAGLGGIEWSADTHVPHGDLEAAEAALIGTLRAGLTISAYGSFYRVGSDGVAFASVLETARRLQAPTLRVWAAPRMRNGEASFASEARRIADAAGKHGVTVCLEAHERSSVRDYATLAGIVHGVDHPFFRACWSPLPGLPAEDRREAAGDLADVIALVHVRNWTEQYGRMPLAESAGEWAAIIAGLAAWSGKSVLDRWALIEYLEDDTPQTLGREAAALAAVLGEAVRAAAGAPS